MLLLGAGSEVYAEHQISLYLGRIMGAADERRKIEMRP